MTRLIGFEHQSRSALLAGESWSAAGTRHGRADRGGASRSNATTRPVDQRGDLATGRPQRSKRLERWMQWRPVVRLGTATRADGHKDMYYRLASLTCGRRSARFLVPDLQRNRDRASGMRRVS